MYIMEETDKKEKQIFKIYKLNSDGKKEEVYVFQGSLDPVANLNELFSEIELKEMEVYNTKVVYSNQRIHKDDSVRTIKKKIINEIGSNTVCYDEIYLFSTILHDFNLLKYYQEITHNEHNDFTHTMLLQLLMNLNVDDDIVHNFNVEKIYKYDDLLTIIKHDKYELKVPIGQKFTKTRNVLFSANPFDILPNSSIVYKTDPENPLALFDNDLLFNFGDFVNDTFFLCLAPSVFEYSIQNSISEEFISQVYYPLLAKNEILKKSDFLSNQQQLLSQNKKLLDKNTLKYYDTINFQHEVIETAEKKISYVERGISQFDIVLHPETKTILPLDAIFKNIHAKKNMAFIKYNPGSRKENIYRLYAEQISRHGKKIPYLSSNTIIKLSKQLGKNRQISVFLQAVFQEVTNEFYIHFQENGNVNITSELSKAVNPDELTKYIEDNLNPVINDINLFLEKTGYHIQKFESLTHDNVEILELKYKSVVSMNKPVSLKENTGCLTTVFDVINPDMKDKATLLYKRVANFQKMDAIASLITEVFKRTNSERAVLSSLMQNYNLSQEEALKKIAEFLNGHTRFQGRYINKEFDIAESPGFETSFYVRPFEKQFVIEINNINSIHYIEAIDIYTESFIRINQYPETVKFSEKKIKDMCSKATAVQDESHVDNVVIPANIQPISFAKNVVFPGEDEYADEIYEDDEELIVNEDEDIGFIPEDDEDEEATLPIPQEDEGFIPSSPTEETSEQVKEDPELPHTPSPEELGFFPQSPDGSEDKQEGGDMQNEELFDNKPFKKKNIFFNKMKKLEPTLFLTKPEGKFDAYSRLCPTNVNKQPVMLTQEEKEKIDREHPGSYDQSIEYGTDPNKKYHYICPRYWCLLTDSPISEEELKSGKCGNIIPKDAKTIPKGSYVYEFTDDKYHTKEGKYVKHNPGFMDDGVHPKSSCLPCCYSNWNSNKRNERIEQCENPDAKKNAPEESMKMQNLFYVVGFDKYPKQSRWGFLPPSVELFLQIDHNRAVTKNNSALIKPNTPILLRYGVEQSVKQSFIGCLADIYGSQKGSESPSIKEMRKIIGNSVTLDMFLKYHNGSLVSVFQTKKEKVSEEILAKYKDTVFYNTINESDEMQNDFFEDTVASFENFLKFLNDDDTAIDHTYLWDIITSKNDKLFNNGFNLVILRMTNNDITDNIEILCPVNSYSKNFYSETKDTIILLKNEDFYEPIYLYEIKENKITVKKSFREETAFKNIQKTLRTIKNSLNNYCAPLASKPKVYKFDKNSNAIETFGILAQNDYQVTAQIMNYQTKVIGLLVKKTADVNKEIFVPCFPSAAIDEIPIKFMENAIWSDYETTRDELMDINEKTGIKCKPLFKVIENQITEQLRSVVIVGILTQTNQFIQIFPPIENTIEDELKEIKNTNYIIADNILTMHNKPDEKRIQAMKTITLETEMYVAFRSTIRVLLNQYKNKKYRTEVVKKIENNSYLYKNKVRQIELLLRKMSKKSITFVQELPKEVLDKFLDLSDTKKDDNVKYCLVNDDNECNLLLPKNHLVSGADNENIYFARVADELVRYNRIRLFMLQPKTYLNITNMNYKINDNEFLLLQSLLTLEYFKDLMPFQTSSYVNNITYDFAAPVDSQNYLNTNVVEMKEQSIVQNNKSDLDQMKILCIKETREVYGNKDSYWKTILPKTCKEIVLNKEANCSFYLLIHILYEKTRKIYTINNIKEDLLEAYNEYITTNLVKIENILIQQGKVDIVKKIKTGLSDFQTAIMSEDYYVTNLDLWLLAIKMKLPIVLFSEKNFKTMITDVKWLVLAGELDEIFYFVRTPIVVEKNIAPAYQLITPGLKFDQIKGFTSMIQSGLDGVEEYKKSLYTFDTFLSMY